LDTETEPRDAVRQTYGSDRLADRLLESLAAAGYDPGRLTAADLIAFDELHVMGREATQDLGRRAGLDETMRVLDVGCGVGGPARTLAAGFGCRVTGVDLAETFVHAATVLSRRLGLEGRVAFHNANALHLPHAAETFDAAFLIHVSMNIADKQALLAELRRVLKPRGKLVLWEICRGRTSPVIFPVPWADSAAFSHLVPADQWIDLMTDSGLTLLHYEEASDEARQWVRARMNSTQTRDSRRPHIDLDLVLPDFRRKRINMSRNLIQGSIAILRAIAVK
jgi:sarcosine/dimethylglycine N-methyltransferase